MKRQAKEVAYRVSCLVSQGMDRNAAEQVALQEYRALADAKAEHHKRRVKDARREIPQITAGYGLNSRVGKAEPGKERFTSRPFTKNPMVKKSDRQIPASRVLALVGGK